MSSYKYYIRLGVDFGCFILSYLFAYLLRFDYHIPEEYLQVALITLPWVAVWRFASFRYFGLFKGVWRYTSITDLLLIFKANAVSSVAIAAGVYLSHSFATFPRSVFLLDWGLLIFLSGGIRLLRRLFAEGHFVLKREGKRTLIVGAGKTGELLVRALRRSEDRYNPVAFVDDDVSKHHFSVHGLKVLGNIESIPAVVREHAIEEVVVALNTARGKRVREILNLCRKARVSVKMVASLQGEGQDAPTGSVRELTLEDVVGRVPVKFDEELIRRETEGKRVMVTGAGGSIGSELCFQLMKYEPGKLLLFDRNELGIFSLQHEFFDGGPQKRLVPVIGDIGDSALLDRIMDRWRPQIIYHAAALKHVPLTEVNPEVTIKNNLFGTRCLADAACRWGVEKFVLLSTDKAANPVNFMGVSKRLCEQYIKGLSETKGLRFLSVRFGNVLESSGSVVPIFREQIRQRKPLTVTHPEAVRYFISKSEAAQLVLQAAALGKGGEIFVLDMGDPVKIVDLARELVFLAGMKPDEDVEIVFTGLRPGEKVVEELFGDGENFVNTPFEKIMLVVDNKVDWVKLNEGLRELEEKLCCPWDRDAVNAKLKGLAPNYRPRPSQ